MMNRTFKGFALAAAAVFFLVLAVSALQTQAPDTAKDPVCGMSVKIATAKYISDYKGAKYYFCSAGCKTSFDKEPDKYLANPGSGKMGGGMGGGMMMHGQLAAQTPDTAKDPVCGMSVKISTAKYISDYKGAKYYFCSEGCKTSFDKEPEKYLAKAGAQAGGGMMGGGMMSHDKMEGCPMMLADVDKKVENTKDGVIITLSSKNAETVKKIQDHVAKMAAGKMPDGGCPMGASCPMNKK
jgi:YHS domain-containing protein